jgi:hypothetical protein
MLSTAFRDEASLLMNRAFGLVRFFMEFILTKEGFRMTKSLLKNIKQGKDPLKIIIRDKRNHNFSFAVILAA